MRAYITAVIFIASCHIYYSIIKNESPLNIYLLILVLSPFIPYIWKEISKVKFSKDGIELERLKKDVDQTIKKAAIGSSIDPKSIDDLFKTVELNEWITLVLARMLMRNGLVFLVKHHDLGPSPSLSKLIPLSFKRGLINESEKNDLEKLRDITFYAEWWSGRVPSHAQWNWALNYCKPIIRNLFEKQPVTG